jgi:hypothetical protein
VSDHKSDGGEAVGQTEVASSARTDHSDDEVTAGPIGYGRPPKHSQFAMGKSGNPKGRPTGSKNFGLVIEAELNAKIPINGSAERSLSARRSPSSSSTRPRRAIRRPSRSS